MITWTISVINVDSCHQIINVIQHSLTIIRKIFSLISTFAFNLFKCLLGNVTIISVKLHQIWSIIILELTLCLVSASITNGESLNVNLTIFGSILIIIVKFFKKSGNVNTSITFTSDICFKTFIFAPYIEKL